jgi:hypothetical protein
MPVPTILATTRFVAVITEIFFGLIESSGGKQAPS